MPRRDTSLWYALAGLALLPRALAALVHRPWHDEYFTAWVAHLPWPRLVDALRVDSGPPLPYVLAKLATAIGLDPIVAARAVAVAAGTAAVVVAARATARAFGATAGFTAGVLLALHPLAVAWASEARAYSLLLLAAALAWDGLTSLRAEGSGAMRLGVAVALGCWSHGLGLVLAGTVGVATLALPAASRRRGLVAAAAGLLALAPWLPVTAQQPPGAVAWMSISFDSLPAWAQALAGVRLLPPAAAFGTFTDLPTAPLVVQIAASLLTAGLLAAACRDPLAWLAFGLPALGLTVLAALHVPVLYPGRAEALYLVPVAALLASRAGRSRWARASVGTLAFAGGITTIAAVAGWASQPPRPEARIAATIRAALPRGGTVVTSGYWWLELWYHLDEDGRRYDLVEVPSSAARHPGWYAETADRPAPDEVAALAGRLAGDARAVAIVVTPGLVTAAPLERLAAHLDLVPGMRLPNGDVFLPPVASHP